MNELESELFSQFLNYCEYLLSKNLHDEYSLLWPENCGELKLENFRNFYSFGLMGTSLMRYKKRIIYEVMSREFKALW